MAGWSVALRNQILDKILRNTDFSITGPLKISLHSADPALTGTNEIVGGSYARQNVAFDAASNAQADGTSDVTFTGMPVTDITHVTLWDNTAFLISGALTTPKSIANSGDSFVLNANDIIVALNQGG